MKKGNYKVKFINYGELCEVYHFNKSIKEIKKGYELEKLTVVDIQELEGE